MRSDKKTAAESKNLVELLEQIRQSVQSQFKFLQDAEIEMDAVTLVEELDYISDDATRAMQLADKAINIIALG